MTDIGIDDLQELLQHFVKNTYKASSADSITQAIMQRCILLANLDYTHTLINNNNGDLCAHYPSHIIILEYESHRNQNISDVPPNPSHTTETIYESTQDVSKLKDLIVCSRFARCRSRFPLPVILYKGRYVCRSATLSGGPEIYARSGYEYFVGNEKATPVEEEESEIPSDTDWVLFSKYRHLDIRLLKALNVGTIIDFMVEKKKVKFGLNVTSSEKVDKENRYSDFTIMSLPYPGCEFFKEFRENDYSAGDLVFDWSQTHVDAEINVPEDSISSQLRINWEQYQVWDLINLTQNYFKLILKYLVDSSNGLLIHCISGWDRTPLFISLLRISLWADGVIHTSLTAHQLLYFTIAYDWMLFGHDLHDRVEKGEDIFYFCFTFLKHITEEEFSVNKRGSKHVLRNDSDLQLDNVMFDGEPVVPLSSVSSNLSLNSCCSNVSQNSRDSQDNNPPVVFHCNSVDSQEDSHSNNGNVVPSWNFYPSPNKDSSSTNNSRASPLPSATTTITNRTSPVAVPVPGRVRQRNESSSSSGSWQMISGCGSLRGTTTANSSVNSEPMTCSNCSNGSSSIAHMSQESSTTVIEDCCFPTKRKNRLEHLRKVFMSVYSQTVGLRMKDNSETTGISQLFGNIAEKVGILSMQRATT